MNLWLRPTTLPETNIAPENGWLEYYFPIGKAYFQGQTVSFREGIPLHFQEQDIIGAGEFTLTTSSLGEGTRGGIILRPG